MKVLLSWLREYVDVPYSVEELEERLPMLGLGIEGITRAGEDAVIDLEIPANRGDLMSIRGVARELAAASRTAARFPAVTLPEDVVSIEERTAVEVTDYTLCPRFTARMIEDVRVGPSPSWLARRLESCGVRSINNIVDVTNYVMLEMGQPMHAFDCDRLTGHRLVVRLSRPGERLTTLDGVERSLDAQALVVADAERAAGIAGIIGGGETEIGPETRRVLLEAASWNPAMIRRTSRRLGVRTESSARFERGIDTAGIPPVQTRAIRLMQELAGGRVLRGMIDRYPEPVPARSAELRWSRVARLLGLEIPQTEGLAILRSLGFEVASQGDVVRVTVPSHRRDVEREEDLIEEVARHYGYDRIPSTMPVEIMGQGMRAASLDAEDAVRDALVRAGLVEALTLSLTNPAALETLRLPADHPWRQMAALSNPMVEEHSHLRTTLLPALVNVARVNVSRDVADIQIFELGRTFHPEDGRVVERRRLALLMTGRTQQGTWNLPPGSVTATYYHLKGVVEGLLDELHVGGGAIVVHPSPWLHPGRAAQLTVRGEAVGTLGELHPEVAAAHDLPSGVYVAEIDLDALLAHAVLTPQFAALPRYPSVRRDVALVLPDSVPASAVDAVIRDVGGPLLESVALFDVYTGPPIPAGQRNLAYALSFRSLDRTLTADEVEEAVETVRQALRERLRAKIRE